MRTLLSRLAPVFFLLLVLTLWEAIGIFAWVPDYLLPRPTAVFTAITQEPADFRKAFQQTVVAASLGFVLSVSIGFTLALLFSSSRLLFSAVYPFAVFFQTVPIIGIAPLLVVWFGYGIPSVVASAFIVSLFPMLATSLTGLRSVDPNLIDLFRLYQANWRVRLFKLLIPAALPSILSGLKIVAGLAIIGTIVGEFMGGVGLGSLIDVARTQQRMDRVFAAIGLASLLGFATVSFLDWLGRRLLRHWHPSEARTA